MTCRMGALQQKKRLAGSNMQDEYRGKRKGKLEPSDLEFDLRSHVDLKWDGVQKKVVPKKEQVGISWSDLSPFIDSITQPRSGLADVFYVPREIFSLENMNSILTDEVWTSCLTEAEREFLTQFLPDQASAEQVVHQLLNGENFHFGNPFTKWSTYLCSGKLHPDMVLNAEEEMRINKIAYCTQLNTYHKDMLEVLQKWKERWLSCCDPEKFLSDSHGVKNEALISLEDKMESKYLRKPLSEKISHNSDAAKFMSCIKVSRTQFDLVKNMKNSADGIHSKLLKRVLGDVENFHVQLFQTYNEEEELRLHEHWLQVTNKDLPAALEVRKNRKLLLEAIRKSLVLEIAEKTTIVMDETAGNSDTGMDGEEENVSPHSNGSIIAEMEDNDVFCDTIPQMGAAEIEYSSHERASELNNKHYTDDEDVNEGKEYTITSMQAYQMEKAPPIDNYEEQGTLVLDPSILPIKESSTLYQSPAENVTDSEVMETKNVVHNQQWQAVNDLGSYYCSENQIYSRSASLALKPTHLWERQQPHVVDLKSSLIGQDRHISVAPSFHLGNSASIFLPPSGQQQNEQIEVSPKDSGIISSSYSFDHISSLKQSVVDMQHLSNNALPTQDHFPSIFQEQKQLMDNNNNGGLYAHSMNKNVYAANRLSSQGPYPFLDQRPIFPTRSNVDSNFSWFSGGNQPTHNNWSGIDPVNSFGQCLPSGCSSNGDGSLLSILSQCNQVNSCSQLSNTSSCQHIQSKNAIPRADNLYGYTRHPSLINMNSNVILSGTLPTNGATLSVAPRNLLDVNTGTELASLDPSITNQQWAYLPQNSGLSDPMNKHCRGPWGG